MWKMQWNRFNYGVTGQNFHTNNCFSVRQFKPEWWDPRFKGKVSFCPYIVYKGNNIWWAVSSIYRLSCTQWDTNFSRDIQISFETSFSRFYSLLFSQLDMEDCLLPATSQCNSIYFSLTPSMWTSLLVLRDFRPSGKASFYVFSEHREAEYPISISIWHGRLSADTLSSALVSLKLPFQLSLSSHPMCLRFLFVFLSIEIWQFIFGVSTVLAIPLCPCSVVQQHPKNLTFPSSGHQSNSKCHRGISLRTGDAFDVAGTSHLHLLWFEVATLWRDALLLCKGGETLHGDGVGVGRKGQMRPHLEGRGTCQLNPHGPGRSPHIRSLQRVSAAPSPPNSGAASSFESLASLPTPKKETKKPGTSSIIQPPAAPKGVLYSPGCTI